VVSAPFAPASGAFVAASARAATSVVSNSTRWFRRDTAAAI
jgi:hypothetical protein